MNDEERVEKFYLFPLKKRRAAGDLLGLQYVHSAVLWKGINYHIEGRGLDGHYEKNPVTKTAKCWPQSGVSVLGRS